MFLPAVRDIEPGALEHDLGYRIGSEKPTPALLMMGWVRLVKMMFDLNIFSTFLTSESVYGQWASV
jgi:hypothetical protein